MALVDSLLTAIVRADGDALVMHVGEKPYVVASAASVELSTQGLNLEAMVGMLAQLLPAEMQRALAEFGAVEHQLPTTPAMDGDRFTVVAARGGDDVWIEIRRHRRPRVAAVAAGPVEGVAAVASVAPAERGASPAASLAQHAPAMETGAVDESGASESVAAETSDSAVVAAVASAEPALTPDRVDAAESASSAEPVADAEPLESPEAVAIAEPIAATESAVAAEPAAEEQPIAPSQIGADSVSAAASFDAEPARAEAEALDIANAASEEPVVAETVAPAASAEPIPFTEPAAASPADEPETPAAAPPPAAIDRPEATAPAQTTTAEVIQMTRTVRIDISPKQTPPSGPPHIERLLGIAAARGAAALYLTAQTPPALRLDDEVRIIEGEPALTSTDVESGVVELMPEASREALRHGDPSEWVADLANVGRVRCSTFRDHRGCGAVFQLISVLTADQLGFSPDMQALATETEGLVLIATPRGAGKSTMLGAFVDMINRQHSYVITLERQIRLVHDNRNALISQREVPGTSEQVLRVTRGALRENPDVLVIDDLGSAEALQLALEAAGSGLLVFMAVTAGSATAALNRVIELFPPDRRKEMQALIAERLRGVVAQALLRKSGGGRVVARELLLTTASVTRILSDGQLSELPSAIESGRRHGMTSLTDALVDLIRSGVVDVREAYRKADDRDALLDALKREKIDVSPVERLA